MSRRGSRRGHRLGARLPEPQRPADRSVARAGHLDYLRAEHARGLQAAVLCPIGFLCDHIEVLYDLDHEAADVARQLDLPLARAETVNDDPLFLGTMADLVLQTWTRYQRGVPLALAPTTAPERLEGPPVRRS